VACHMRPDCLDSPNDCTAPPPTKVQSAMFTPLLSSSGSEGACRYRSTLESCSLNTCYVYPSTTVDSSQQCEWACAAWTTCELWYVQPLFAVASSTSFVCRVKELPLPPAIPPSRQHHHRCPLQHLRACAPRATRTAGRTIALATSLPHLTTIQTLAEAHAVRIIFPFHCHCRHRHHQPC
jgi:hypothetical protein